MSCHKALVIVTSLCHVLRYECSPPSVFGSVYRYIVLHHVAPCSCNHDAAFESDHVVCRTTVWTTFTQAKPTQQNAHHQQEDVAAGFTVCSAARRNTTLPSNTSTDRWPLCTRNVICTNGETTHGRPLSSAKSLQQNNTFTPLTKRGALTTILWRPCRDSRSLQDGCWPRPRRRNNHHHHDNQGPVGQAKGESDT